MIHLPHEPESIESARRRIGQSLVRLWDSEAMEKAGGGERPGLLRDHVFDFEDGVRLIVSRDWVRSQQRTYLHVSGSCTLDRVRREGWREPGQQVPAVVARFDEIFDLPPLTHARSPLITPKGIVHLIFPLMEHSHAAET